MKGQMWWLEVKLLVFMLTLALVAAQYKYGGSTFPDIANSTSEIMTSKTTLCENIYYNWPDCIDTPKGYTCVCGPGFYWNTKICISDAVDSRLEFAAPELAEEGSDQKPAFAYTLLLNKPFPKLEKFTMSMYLKPSAKFWATRQCVFSYKYLRQEEVLIFSLFIGKKLELTIHNQTVSADPGESLKNGWSNLVVTWSSTEGIANIYINEEKLELKGEDLELGKDSPIESNGHMVLGQYSPDSNFNYDLSLAYVGSLAHVNIWKTSFSDQQLQILYEDCTFTHCGDGVEWVDLREGTRGISRLRWPSGIDSDTHCFTNDEALITCDQYCSFDIGVQCKEEIQESVTWPRTPATNAEGTDVGTTLVLRCPGYELADNSTKDIPMATRSCTSSQDKVGIWALPQMDKCLSDFFVTFSAKVRYYTESSTFDKSYIMELLARLRNHTKVWNYDDPVDLSVTIQSLSQIIDSQRGAIAEMMAVKREAMMMMYTEASASGEEITFADSIHIADLYLDILNDVMDAKNIVGWNKTRPQGQLADELLQLIDNFTYVFTLSLQYHFLNSQTTHNSYRKSLENIAIKVMIIERSDFHGIIFPDQSDISNMDMTSEPADVSFIPASELDVESIFQSEHLFASALRLNTFSQLLYDPRYGRQDRINTPVVNNKLFESVNFSLHVPNITITTSMKLFFSDANNVSNPECTVLKHGDSTLNKIWNRNSNNPHCTLVDNDTKWMSCECEGKGYFAGTTDMFNNNWQIADPPPELMTLPSYLGCSISLLLCMFTLGTLIYVGTSSRTAIMHKHYSVAVICNTAIFMFGITLTHNEKVCKGAAILFHYFFVSMYAWLMNEGFNVYISITYTAHNQSTQENSGHWRYYIIGWGVPGVLVSAIVGSTFDTYFSKDMCFASWDNIWLFAGPPLAMICVTLLVMTFAAKENNEVSYTKNESANAMTEYHANAIWTQLILVTCTWAIAFLSLRYKSIVFKWVFFIFNCAQGAFLFVFFFLLNEEVRSVFKTKEIKQQLGWDVSGPIMKPSSQEFGQHEDMIPLNSEVSASQPLLGVQQQEDWTEEERSLISDNTSSPFSLHPHLPKKPIELDSLTETSV